VQITVFAFHHRFRQIIAMNPRQFQQWLRLSQARQLMFTADLDAKAADVAPSEPKMHRRQWRRLAVEARCQLSFPGFIATIAPRRGRLT
jgi:AraC-like DNA-binding protein